MSRMLFFYCAILLCVGMLGYMSMAKIAHEIGAVRGYAFHCGVYCSPFLCSALRAYGEQQSHLPIVSLGDYARAISCAFPSLKTVSCLKDAEKIVHVTCENDRPFLCLNEAYVLTDEGHIVAKHFFSPESLTILPTIVVSTTRDGVPALSSAALTALRMFDIALCDRYSVTWLDDAGILFNAKNAQEIPLVAQVHALPDSATIDLVDRIKKENESKNLIGHSNKKRLVADIRFVNQIILNADAGGHFDGKK